MCLKIVTWALALSGALPGFEWLTPKGFIIGLAKSFRYGALIGLVYVPIYNALARRFEA